jgi:hypothetical protein
VHPTLLFAAFPSLENFVSFPSPQNDCPISMPPKRKRPVALKTAAVPPAAKKSKPNLPDGLNADDAIEVPEERKLTKPVRAARKQTQIEESSADESDDTDSGASEALDAVPEGFKRLIAERLEYTEVEKPNKEATMHGDAQALKRRFSCLQDLGSRPVGLDRTLILHLAFDRSVMRYKPTIIASDSSILPPVGKAGKTLAEFWEKALGVPAGSLESSAVKAADIQTRTLDDLICNAAMRTRNPQPPHLFRLRPAVQSILANPLRLSLRQQKVWRSPGNRNKDTLLKE